MTSYLNTINSEGVVLNLNNTAGQGVVIGNSLTSILGSRTFGDSTIGAITGTSSATFSTTLGVTGLTTLSGGLVSTAGATTLGTTTIGTITGTSATFSSTLGVTGVTTLSQTTIGAITGTSATFSSNTSSSSKTTGALTVVGGISTEENINIGGYIGLFGSTSGIVSIKTQANSGTYNYNLPTSAGSSGQVLTSQGGSTSAMTWTTPTVGTVTSVALSVPSFLSISGSPITTNGTLAIGLSGTALDVQNGGTGVTSFTSNSLLLGNGSGAIAVSSGASYSLNTLTLPKIISNDSTSSTTSSTGSILVSGGIGISNTSDATSSTNGGSITTAGGVAIAKKLFVGGSSSLNGLDLNSTRITNLLTPTLSSDAATKGYVDLAIQGLDAKNSVVVATTVSGVMISSFQNGQAVDGVTLTTGDRILIKNQGDVNNGIYVVNTSGAPTRSIDFDTGLSVAGSFIFVEKGTVNSDSGWVCSSDSGSDIVGTNTLTFVQFSGAGSIIAGTGLTKSGNELSVNSSQTQITQLGTITTGVWNSSVISVPYGGTGSTSFTSNSLLIGNGTGSVTSSSGASYSSNTLTLPKIILNDTTASTSNSTGSFLVSGGIGISNTTDATSITNGGSITTAGGVSIAKKLYTGSDVLIAGKLGVGTDVPFYNFVVRQDQNAFTTLEVRNNNQTIDTSGSQISFGGYRDSNQTSHILSAIRCLTSPADIPQVSSGELTFLTGRNDSGANYSQLQEHMRITRFGNIGIGTTTPGAKLDVSGNIRGTSSVFTDATSSTSSVSGSVLLSGGIGISNTTDAVSITNGGTITTAGGAAVAKKLFVGDSITSTGTTSSTGFLARGSTSGVVSILPQPNSGTFNFNLPITPGATGQILASAGGGSAPMSWITPALAAAPQTYNASGSQSQASPVDVAGLFYTTGSFDISMTVDIVATTSLKQIFKITGLLSPSSGWSINAISITGDNSLVSFTITAGGQVRYTSGTYPGFVSLTFYWSQFSTTQGVGYLALSGANSGIVTISPQPDAGIYNYNLPTTAGTAGQVLTSSGGGSSPMTWANFTSGDISITGTVYQTLSGTVNRKSLSSLIPSLADDNANAIVIGSSETLNQSGVVRFVKKATTNYVGIGMFGNDDSLNVLANGNIGIGTTTPSHKLSVIGTIRQFPTGTADYSNYFHVNGNNNSNTSILNPGLLLYNESDSGSRTYGLDLGYSSSSSRFRSRLFCPDIADISFSSIPQAGNSSQNGYTDRMVIRGDSGNVGIGTDFPRDILDVQKSNASITISGLTETDLVSLKFRTPNSTFDGKTAIICEGLNNWSRSKMHFCLDNTAANDATSVAKLENARMTIQPDGNVGIGTTSPGYKLHVISDIQTTEPLRIENTFSGNNDLLTMLSPNLGNNNNNSIVFGKNETTSNSFLLKYNHISNSNILNTMSFELLGNSRIMTLVGNGNVGIGTTDPSGLLHLRNNTNQCNIVFEAGKTSDGINEGYASINFNGYYNTTEQRINTDKNRWRISVDQKTSSDKFIIDTYNGTTVDNIVQITTDGNVGIGTTSSGYKLDVNGNIKAGSGGVGLLYGTSNGISIPGGTYTNLISVNFQSLNGNTDVVSLGTPGSNSGIQRIQYGANGVIYLNGNVGIGTASPSSSLDVNGPANFSSSLSANQKMRSGISGGGSATGTITFSPAFTSTPYVVATVDKDSSTDMFLINVHSVSVNGFSYRKKYQNNSGGSWVDSTSESFHWIAMVP